jgi:SsrA-binding protein
MKFINKKAYYDYFVIEEFNCGIMLQGSEVKSLRRGDVNFSDSHIIFKDGEVYIKNLRIDKYKEATYLNHDEMRDKKLLLTKKEISNLSKSFSEKGIAIIPLEIFILKNRFKLKIGICRGKKNYDRRETIKKRDIERELQRKF